MRSKLLPFLCLVPAVVAACDGGPTETKPVPGITAVAGHALTDTVDAVPLQALTVRVLAGDPAVPAAGVVVRFASVPVRAPAEVCHWGCSVPSMWVSGLADTGFKTIATPTTGAEGRASVRVSFGRVVGEGKIHVSVPELGLEDTIRYTIQPGAPAHVRLLPRDTLAYLGNPFTARPAVVDRFGNARSEVPALTGTHLSVEGTQVTGTRHGVFRLHATFGELKPDSMGVSIVPKGTAAFHASGTMLTVLNLDGSGRTTLELGTANAGYDWAADGSAVYAALNVGGAYRLHTVKLDGSRARLPVNAAGVTSEMSPQLSADGQWIYFVGVVGYETYLHRVRTDGSGAERLVRLAISTGYWNAQTYGVSPDNAKVATADNDGVKLTDLSTRVTTVINAGLRPSFLRWSSDGEWIAAGTSHAVVVMKPDGTGQRVVATRYYPRDYTMDWSPDGKWLLYEGDRSVEVAEAASGLRIPMRIVSGARLSWKP